MAVAPLAARWIERLLAAHEPPLTTPQYLALRAIAREQVSVNELARRAGVSGPAASQLVTALADAGLLDRRTAEEDRRRQEHALTAKGRNGAGQRRGAVGRAAGVADRGSAPTGDRRTRAGAAAGRGGAVGRRPATPAPATAAAASASRSSAAPAAIDSRPLRVHALAQRSSWRSRSARGRSAGIRSQLTVLARSHARREIADHPRAGRTAGPAGEIANRARGRGQRSGHAGRERSARTSVVRTRAKPGREIALLNRRSASDGIRLDTWWGRGRGRQRLVCMHLQHLQRPEKVCSNA